MCNPWQRDGDPVVRVKRPRMSTLFELCCNALAANEPLFHSVTSTLPTTRDTTRTHTHTHNRDC